MTNLLAIFAAIIAVESGGNDAAINKKEQAFGCAQIRQCVIEDVNRKYGTTWQHEHAFDRDWSYLIFCQYTRMWCTEKRLGRVATAEDISRAWNGGGPSGWRKKSTVRYWEKVKKEMVR